jgi:hypothetical protein
MGIHCSIEEGDTTMVDGFWIVQFEGVQGNGGGVIMFAKQKVLGGDSGYIYTGGVVLVGMKARKVAPDEPDVIDSPAPVADTTAVKSRVLDLIGQLVEPGIEGIQVAEANEPAGSKSGFVVVYVPPSEGSPRRSRKDWKFYLRIGSGTFPMEYFQLEERFGKRPTPRLDVYLEFTEVKGMIFEPSTPARWFVLGLRNVGRGIAKFPSIAFKRIPNLNPDTFGIDGNGGVGLPQHPSESERLTFRGGDHVVYPGEILKITKLYQRGTNVGPDGLPYQKVMGANMQPRTPWRFPQFSLQCDLSCEGTPTVMVEKEVPEHTVVV